jgi:4-amino-4-deoxy-L-arabinose transferase-like glycosyltransferase
MNLMIHLRRPTSTRLAFAALSLFFLGTSLIWLRLDHSPPSWDDAYYLANSLVLYDSLAEGGVPGYARQFLTMMCSKPPLIAALPTPVYLIFGRKPRAAYLINLVFLLVILSAVYWLGKRYASPRAGLLAAAIVGTMPMIYGLSRWFLVECGLTALVCVAMCVLAEWNRFDGAWKGFLLGAACGLGLLMKTSFPFFIAIPILYFVWRMRPRALLASAAAAALIAAPWYLVHWRAAFQTAVNAGSATTANVYGTGAVFSLADIWNYCVNLANTGPTLYFLALPILAVAFFRTLQPAAMRGLLLCAMWAAPILFLIFGHYRDLRYAAPCLPALALALGILLDMAFRKRFAAAAAITAVLLALPLLSMLQTSFGILGDRRIEMGGLLFVAPRFDYAREYRAAEWPQQAILADIYRTSRLAGGEKIRLLLGTDSVRFNADNFRLAAIQSKLPFEISTTAYESDAGKLPELLALAAFFVYKDGGEREAPFFNVHGAAAVNEMRKGGRFVELPFARPLPDGGVVHVFANRFRDRFQRGGAFLSAGLDSLPDCNVTFAGKLQLTGLALDRTADGMEVKYRWRCLKPVDRDYWCFTHIVDTSGNIVGYLDHQILSGDPPTSQWKDGDIAVERLLFPLSANQSGATYHLRLGLFDRATGERLPISASTFTVTGEGTAVEP